MRIIFLYTLLFTCTISAQTKFLDINIKNKESRANIKNALIFEDKESKALFTFLEEEKITYGFKHNKSKERESELISKGLKRKYKTIIGKIVNGDVVRLLETNKENTKFASILFDFNTKITKESEYDFKLGFYDFYIQSYSSKDACYMFTYNSESNKLCKWTFLIDGTFKQDFYNLKENYDSSDINSENYLDEKFQKVNNKLPNNLSIATKEYKMYELDDGFILTLDDNVNYTLVIEFNAPDFSPIFSKISNPILESGDKTTNSYIFEDKIAQIVSNNSHLVFEVKDFKSKTALKSISVTKKDTINFKNGPILQEGSTYGFGKTRKLEKTSKFLRKISNQNNGVSVYPQNGNYRITIGGVVERSGGGGMMMPGFGGFTIGQFGAFTMSFNPAGFAYGSYTYTGSTRIECLFDNEFNHIKGKIKDNVFDRVNQYKDNIQNLHADNIFYLDNKVFFGFYQPAIKTYELIQIE